MISHLLSLLIPPVSDWCAMRCKIGYTSFLYWRMFVNLSVIYILLTKQYTCCAHRCCLPLSLCLFPVYLFWFYYHFCNTAPPEIASQNNQIMHSEAAKSQHHQQHQYRTLRLDPSNPKVLKYRSN